MAGRRWENYVLACGDESPRYWADLLSGTESNVLYITGQGFDPRMGDGLRVVLEAGGGGRRDSLLLIYRGDQLLSEREEGAITKNRAQLDTAIDGRGTITELPLRLRDEQRKFVGADDIAASLRKVSVEEYDHVVLDVSSTPRTIALTALAQLLYKVDHLALAARKRIVNLHVIATENSEIDSAIMQLGIDEIPIMLPYFVAEIDAERSASEPRIWFPILGEGKVQHFGRLNEYINPSEICPVLPSPSTRPRRGDELIEEYREMLFDTLRVDPRNIIFASETNPFECYRQLYQSIESYRDTLAIVGGCKAFVSPLSSRLLSVGALIACYELKDLIRVGIAYVETHNYNLDVDAASAAGGSVVYTLWLAGDAYV